MDKTAVLAALRTVQDPDLKQDLVALGMIHDLQVTDKQVAFTLMLTTPACPLQEHLKQACIAAIHTHVAPGLEVAIRLSAQVTSTRAAGPLLPGVKNLIAIASGKGGVGKSTLAANMARALALQGAQVGLLDADIFGPSLPMMLGCAQAKPQVTQVQGKNHLVPLQQHGVRFLSIGLLVPPGEAILWRGPMASKALRQLLAEAAWGELDYLLVDLPPGTSDLHLTLVQTRAVTGAVIVTTPQAIALADATKAVALFQKKGVDVPVLGVVENMAYFSPPGQPGQPGQRHYLFGQGGGQALAAQHGVPLLGQVPLVQAIREAADQGKLLPGLAAGAFGQVAQAMAQQVAVHNARQGAD